MVVQTKINYPASLYRFHIYCFTVYVRIHLALRRAGHPWRAKEKRIRLRASNVKGNFEQQGDAVYCVTEYWRRIAASQTQPSSGMGGACWRFSNFHFHPPSGSDRVGRRNGTKQSTSAIYLCCSVSLLSIVILHILWAFELCVYIFSGFVITFLTYCVVVGEHGRVLYFGTK
jgi:hypothetical protein